MFAVYIAMLRCASSFPVSDQLFEGWGKTTMEYKALHEHFDKIVNIIFSSSLEPHWMMELLLFLCLLIFTLLLCLILVATLIVCLLLFTAILLQMYRTLRQQNNANRYDKCIYHTSNSRE